MKKENEKKISDDLVDKERLTQNPAWKQKKRTHVLNP